MKKLAIFAVALLPSTAFAAGITADTGLFGTVTKLINIAIPIIFALAILFFLFKLAMFLFGTGEVKEEAKGGMVWGIVVLLVMFSITGIISLLQESFDVGNSSNIDIPVIKIGNDTLNVN